MELVHTNRYKDNISKYISNPFDYPTRGIEGPKVEDLSPGFEGYLSLGKSLKVGIKRSWFESMVKF